MNIMPCGWVNNYRDFVMVSCPHLHGSQVNIQLLGLKRLGLLRWHNVDCQCFGKMAKQRVLMANLKEVKCSDVSSCAKLERPWLGLRRGLLAEKLTERLL